VTQVVNSVLSLLVFPIQKEDAFFQSYFSVPLAHRPDFLEVRTLLPNFPLLPSLQVRQFSNCKNVRRFFKRVRNAISHRRPDFSSESHDLDEVVISLADVNDGFVVDWEISISA
jgi:hypothetical protein